MVPAKTNGSLEIRLLGSLAVLSGGRAQPMPASKKTRALLAYLVATESAHTRERLCDLLWDGPNDPRAALRWSLAKIRPLLDRTGSVRLRADRERVAFVANGASVDLYALRALRSAEATRAASTEQLEQAAALLRGELLEGLELPDCYGYSEWCRAEREAARGLERGVRLALIERLRAEPERALAHARALCASHPLDQSAHVTVIDLLRALGRHRDALAHYETCRRLLAAELGARPSPALEQARSALGGSAALADQLPVPATVAPPSRVESELTVPAEEPAIEAEAPLVGRAPERAAIERFLQAVPDGDAALLIMGEPGEGKTRLLSELARSVRAAGGVVLRGRAFEAEMIRPYGAWIDALRGSGDATGEADPFAHQANEGGADRTRLFDAVIARLRRLEQGQRTVVVVIDDIHWIDEASTALIHYAVRALAKTRVRIACAARPGELSDNPAARRLVRALHREGQVCQIGLSALDERDTEALVRSLGVEVDAERVFAECGGNPLFALELARALAAHGEALGSLDALLRDRLDQLEGTARELVAWAAAIGTTFSAELLMRVSGIAAAELVRGAAELERRAFIRPAAGPQDASGYDFAHDLMRRAAYHAISEPRRRLMHSAIARVLAGLAETDDALAGDLAHHAALGDEAELAARASAAAAERCVRLFANDEAHGLAERGLHHTQRLSGRVRVQLELRLLRAAIYASIGKPRETAHEVAMERAIVQAQSLGCAEDVARGLLALSYLRFNRGDLAGAASDSLRAEQQARASEPLYTLRTLAHASQCLSMVEREMPRAEALAAEAIELAARQGDDVPELWLAQALLSYHRGELDNAIELATRAFALAAREQSHWIEALSLTRMAVCQLLCGRAQAALSTCADLNQVTSRMGESSEAPFGLALEALARLQLGDAAARQSLHDNLAALRSLDAQAYLAEALCFAAEADCHAGAAEAARALAAEALLAARVSGRASSVVWARTLLARAALALGDRAQAQAQLDLAEAAVTDLPQPCGLSRARVERASAEIAR